MATRKTSSQGRRVRVADSRREKAAAPVRKAAARTKGPAARAKAAPARTKERRQQPEALRLRRLSVALTVNDLERSIRFYTEALGFTIKERWERDGKLSGLALLAGDCELTLVQDDWAKGRDRTKGVGFRIYAATVQDLDALATHVRSRGGDAQGPTTSSWGAYMLAITDPDGFHITIHRRS